MFRLTLNHRHFSPHWGMTLLAILSIALFLRLGFWQLARADEKKHMIVAMRQSMQKSPTDWDPKALLPRQYQSLRMSGQFLSTVLLLDNQHYQHQFGYNVLSPLLLANGKVVLVDRGWVMADAARQHDPMVQTPLGVLSVVGTAYYPSKKSWVLGQVLEKKHQDLAIVERIDTELIGRFLHKSVYPFIIRLEKRADYGYVRDWAIVAMPAERHYGYALQWFTMALVSLILFIALNFDKKTQKKT